MLENQPSSTSSTSKWIINNSSKLQNFLKMPRFFLHSKKSNKTLSESARCPITNLSIYNHKNIRNNEIINESLDSKTEETEEPINTTDGFQNQVMSNEKSEVLLLQKAVIKELLLVTYKEKEISATDVFQTQVMSNIPREVVLQKSVKELLFGTYEEKENAAKVMICLASEDVQMRKSLAELGVIPPLVAMVDSDVVSRRCLAVQALIQLANGTFTNKALILEAGILSKLPSEIDNIDESTRHDLSELLFSISSISNTQFPLNPSKLLPFLLGNLQSNSTSEKTRESCLGTLFNLSAVLENSGTLISNRVIDILLTTLSSSKEKTTEIALATLGNLVVSLMGKKALEDSSMMPESLIDILTWEENPKCQELSAYILMVLAHQSGKQRDKMAKAGIVHVLLEVALLGSPLAQKRALKLLQWFKDERRVSVGPHSGPQTTRQLSMGSPTRENGSNEGKRLMKRMIQQSLYKNMEVITNRANNASGESSKYKSLDISSSSKSLPY